MSSKPEPLHRARIAVRREILDDLFDVFADMDPAPTSWEDMETGEAWVETCDLDLAVLHQRAREMANRLQAYDGRVHAAEITTLPPEEWTEAWKRFFHVARVSPRLVIHPVWEPIDPAPGDIVIDIDPGMSFGTGLHPTTRSCLRLLDERASAAPLGSFLDLGCGSGILSIAAVKLGAAPVAALDYDPDAVAVARENLALNGIPAETVSDGHISSGGDAVARNTPPRPCGASPLSEGGETTKGESPPPKGDATRDLFLSCPPPRGGWREAPGGVLRAHPVSVGIGDVTKDPLPTADLVVANILASVLIDAAPRIAAAVAPAGTLLLSGILDSQFADVSAAYAAQGFACAGSLLDSEWRTGRFVHA